MKSYDSSSLSSSTFYTSMAWNLLTYKINWSKFRLKLCSFREVHQCISINPQHPRLTIPRSVTVAPSSSEETTGPKAYDISGIQTRIFRVSWKDGTVSRKRSPNGWILYFFDTILAVRCYLLCRKSTVPVPFRSLTMAQSKGRFESTICPGDFLKNTLETKISSKLSLQVQWIKTHDSNMETGMARVKVWVKAVLDFHLAKYPALPIHHPWRAQLPVVRDKLKHLERSKGFKQYHIPPNGSPKVPRESLIHHSNLLNSEGFGHVMFLCIEK